jgi:hypothetical protein
VRVLQPEGLTDPGVKVFPSNGIFHSTVRTVRSGVWLKVFSDILQVRKFLGVCLASLSLGRQNPINHFRTSDHGGGVLLHSGELPCAPA